MMNYETLTAELANDPLARDYANMSNQSVADSLNAVDVDILRPIPSTELLAWAAADGRFERIDIATVSGNEATKAIAKVAKLLVSRSDTTLDLNQPDRSAFVDALVAAGIFTAADKESLETLATIQISRAEQLGFAGLNHGHIVHAR